MRTAIAIIVLTGVAIAMVHMRRQDSAVRHEIQRLQLKQISLRRTLWDQHAVLACRTNPRTIEKRVEEILSNRSDRNRFASNGN